MKPQKIYVTQVTVVGGGHFPIDMLRYDSCVPATGEDASKIDNTDYQQKRTVKLRRYCVTSSQPTIDRWRSFLWEVTEVKESY